MTLFLGLCLIYAMPDYPYKSYHYLGQVSLFGFLIHVVLIAAMRKEHLFLSSLYDDMPEDLDLKIHDERAFTLE